MLDKEIKITDENVIKKLIGKRIKINVGELLIEGLLGYYGKPKYTVKPEYYPAQVRKFLDYENQMHLFNLKFYYLDGREIHSDKTGVGYYVLKVKEFPNLIIETVEQK